MSAISSFIWTAVFSTFLKILGHRITRQVLYTLVLKVLLLYYYYGEWQPVQEYIILCYSIISWPLVRIFGAIYPAVIEAISEPFRKETIFCPTNNGKIARELGKNSTSFN